MLGIHKDFRNLKETASKERLKAKNDSKLATTAQDKQWFKSECVALEKIIEGLRSDLFNLRQELASIKEEKRFAFDELLITKADLKTVQRENNILKQQLRIRREHRSTTPNEASKSKREATETS